MPILGDEAYVLSKKYIDKQIIEAGGHTHDNKTTIDKLSEDASGLLLDGKPVKGINFPAMNYVVNGDFSNDLTGWTKRNLTGTISKDTDICVGAASQHIVQNNNIVSYYQDIEGTAGDKYYFSGWLYIVTKPASNNMVWVSEHGSSNNTMQGAIWNYTKIGEWQRAKGTQRIISPTGAGVTVNIGRILADTGEYYVSSLILLNLTEIFGAGNEPDLTTMDEYVAQFDNYYFDGVHDPFIKNDTLFRMILDTNTEVESTNTEITETNTTLQTVLNKNVVDSLCYSHSDAETFIDKTVVDTSAEVYALYDALATAYPDYVTRTLLCNEESPSELPVYRYDFMPPIPKMDGPNDQGNVTTPNPKIFVSSGIHGNEKSTVVDTLRFFTSLCNDWKSSELLSVLRWNVHFVVVPIVNPYGYDNNTLKNYNGVNLNRNFTLGWSLVDISTNNYGGTEPLSEIEAQVVNAIASNEDFIFAVDTHNFATYAYGDKISYMISYNTDNGRTGKFKRNFLKFINLKLKREFAFISQTNSTHTDDVLISASSSTNGMLYAEFSPSSLLWEWVTGWGSKIVDENATPQTLQKYISELLATLLYMAYKEYS